MTAAVMPETYDDASAMLASMKARRADLSRLIEDGATKRRDLALTVQLGGDDQALREHDKIIAAAEAERINVNSAIEAMTGHVETLRGREAKAAAEQAEVNRVKVIDELLVLDDKIDDGLDAVRDLLKLRRDLIAGNARTLHNAAKREDIEDIIMMYFDHELVAFHHGWKQYAKIVRFAERDGNLLKRTSPGMEARGPRAVGPLDKMIRETPSWANAGGGFDSVLENQKFHAARGTKPERYEHGFDVSGSMMHSAGR